MPRTMSVMTRLAGLLSLCALGAGLALPTAAAQAPPPELNQAQLLVFMGEHLRQTRKDQTLVYGFVRNASGEAEQRDEVKMTVTGVVDDVRRDLSFEFLSGEERIDFPDAHGYRGNPIAVQFLERDIRDMSRHTGTPITYFRNRIREAFVAARIVQRPVSLGDTEVDATEITVVPFAADAVLAGFDGYAGKEYRFVYSEQVPGDLVSIRTRMSAADGSALEEALHYRGSADAGQADASGTAPRQADAPAERSRSHNGNGGLSQ